MALFKAWCAGTKDKSKKKTLSEGTRKKMAAVQPFLHSWAKPSGRTTTRLDLPQFRGQFKFGFSSVEVLPVQGYPRGLPVDSSLHQQARRAGCPHVRSTRWVTRVLVIS
jgi:hypothetical protein